MSDAEPDARYTLTPSAQVIEDYRSTSELGGFVTFSTTEDRPRFGSAAVDRGQLETAPWARAYATLNATESVLCERALRELGVRDDLVTDDERRELDENGFAVLRGVLSEEQMRPMHEHLDAVIAATLEASGGRLPATSGVHCSITENETIIGDLLNRDPCYDLAITHPRVLGAVAHLLGPYLKCSYQFVREPRPSSGLEDVHMDTHRMFFEPVHYFANTIWMLDDFTVDNGATRFVPGSHRSGSGPWDLSEQQLHARFPGEVQACGKAGDVIVLDGHVWHGGMQCVDRSRRRAMLIGWAHRNRYQIHDQRQLLQPETYRRLDEPTRWLLDVQQEW